MHLKLKTVFLATIGVAFTGTVHSSDEFTNNPTLLDNDVLDIFTTDIQQTNLTQDEEEEPVVSENLENHTPAQNFPNPNPEQNKLTLEDIMNDPDMLKVYNILMELIGKCDRSEKTILKINCNGKVGNLDKSLVRKVAIFLACKYRFLQVGDHHRYPFYLILTVLPSLNNQDK